MRRGDKKVLRANPVARSTHVKESSVIRFEFLESQRESCRRPSTAVRTGASGNRRSRGRWVRDRITGCTRRARVVGDIAAHVGCEVSESRVVGAGSDGVSLYRSCEGSSVGVRCALSRSLNRAEVGRKSDGSQDAKDQYDDEEFDEREALSVLAS